MSEGREVAQNLSALYDYMIRQLLRGNAADDVACLTEVDSLLGEVRSAWIAIGPEVRQSRKGVANAASAAIAAGAASASSASSAA
jgi:flagellar protein FliS